MKRQAETKKHSTGVLVQMRALGANDAAIPMEDGTVYNFTLGISGFRECRVEEKHLDYFRQGQNDSRSLASFLVGEDAEGHFNEAIFRQTPRIIKDRLMPMVESNPGALAEMLDRALELGKVPEGAMNVVAQLRDSATAHMSVAKKMEGGKSSKAGG